jgi:hypothetical protein
MYLKIHKLVDILEIEFQFDVRRGIIHPRRTVHCSCPEPTWAK